MTPLQFEAAYGAQWDELQVLLDRAEGTPARKKADKQAEKAAKAADGGKPGRRQKKEPIDGVRLSVLYRRACEHLALAQARAYPIGMTQRLETLTRRAHQLIYRRHEPGFGLGRLRRLVLVDIPQRVRAHRGYLLVATLLFVLPTLLVGWACWRDPGFALHLMDVGQLRNFDQMYGPGTDAIGKLRSADTDWQMFGFYIKNNIGVGFQCFAGGLFAGLGSVFFLVFNGLQGGAAAGYLTARGSGEAFYSFVVTHAAFELTAIVLSGAAGLRLGHALIAPGRRTRLAALRHAAADAIVVMYGVIAFLVIAAALEAFWSSARWVAPEVKYGVGAACWALVIAYLGWQGRPARAAAATEEAGHAG